MKPILSATLVHAFDTCFQYFSHYTRITKCLVTHCSSICRNKRYHYSYYSKVVVNHPTCTRGALPTTVQKKTPINTIDTSPTNQFYAPIACGFQNTCAGSTFCFNAANLLYTASP